MNLLNCFFASTNGYRQKRYVARASKRTSVAKSPQCVRITSRALSQITSAIGTRQPEQGGVLGISNSGVISHFYFDHSAVKTGATYSPDLAGIRPVLAYWDMEGVRFCGMIHSHPGNFSTPSTGDLIYAERILKAMPRTLRGIMHMPIVTVDPYSGRMQICWYVARLTSSGRARISKTDLYVDGSRIRGWLRIEKSAPALPFLSNINAQYQKTELLCR